MSDFELKYPTISTQIVARPFLQKNALLWRSIADDYKPLVEVLYKQELNSIKDPAERQKVIAQYAKELLLLNGNKPPKKANLPWLSYAMGAAGCLVSENYCSAVIKYRLNNAPVTSAPASQPADVPARPRPAPAASAPARPEPAPGKIKIGTPKIDAPSGIVDFAVSGIKLTKASQIKLSFPNDSNIEIVGASGRKIVISPEEIDISKNSFSVRLNFEEAVSGSTHTVSVTIDNHSPVKVKLTVPQE